MTAADRQLPSLDIGSTLPYATAKDWQNRAHRNDAWLSSVACEPIAITGTANILIGATIDASVVDIPGYEDGHSFLFIPTVDNSSGMTINVDGRGVKNIMNEDGNALVQGDVKAARLTQITYVGASGHFRLRQGSGTGSDANPAPDLYLRDEKAQNTNGGTATSGAWQTRTLNTVVPGMDILPGYSLSANQFTLQAGTYYVEWRAPADTANQHQTRLFDVTNNVVVPNAIGSSMNTNSATQVSSDSIGRALFTITTATTYRLEHRVASTAATQGFGKAANFTTEIYAEVMIWAVGSVVSRVDGQPGGPVTLTYIFDTTVTDSDPGNGKLRLSVASPMTSSLVLRADLLDVFGNDVTNLLDNSTASTNPTTKARFKLIKEDDPTRYIDFDMSAKALPAGYRNFTVAATANGSAGTSPFVNGDRVLLMIDRVGDQGTAGAAGADGSTNLGFAQSIENGAILVTVASNIITIAVKDKNGNTPSAGSPVRVSFRDTASAVAGGWKRYDVTAALSMTISAGSTLGFANSETNLLHIGFINPVGGSTVELAASRDGALWREDSTISTTAEGGAGGADSGEVIYSTTARAGCACRLACVATIQTGATAGNWSNAPSWVYHIQHGVIYPFKNTNKAWADFTSITTTTLFDGVNISSLTDNGAGDTTINFAVALGSARYSAQVTGERTSAMMQTVNPTTVKTASLVRVLAIAADGTNNDFPLQVLITGWM